jgi:hypothetical protein
MLWAITLPVGCFSCACRARAFCSRSGVEVLSDRLSLLI